MKFNDEILNNFIEETGLTVEDYKELINYGYSEDDIELIFNIHSDYSYFSYDNLYDLGEQLVELYDYEVLQNDFIKRYFNFEEYAQDFIDNEETIQLSDNDLIVIYGH